MFTNFEIFMAVIFVIMWLMYEAWSSYKFTQGVHCGALYERSTYFKKVEKALERDIYLAKINTASAVLQMLKDKGIIDVTDDKIKNMNDGTEIPLNELVDVFTNKKEIL